MPLYDYICSQGHVLELRRSYDEDVITCPECGHIAMRNPINLDQSIITETGSKEGRRAEVPLNEMNKRNSFKLYREAAQELEYKYGKLSEAEGREINPPLARRGMARAAALANKGVTATEFKKQKRS
jgi:putative FmdB family regulatory protein